ncbi:MAG: TolC family outer membrane protein [Rhodobacter sp.]|jgi:outer membrane protein|nr:TolC family outer membrane protein [Rhodobacter sp.]
MRKVKATFIAISTVVALGFSGIAVSAQTLTDTFISAYKNSIQLEIDRAALRALDEGVAQAWAKFRPSASASFARNATYVMPGFGADFTTFTNTLNISSSLTLWDGGETRLATEVARLNVAASRENLTLSEQAVLLSAVTAFMDMRRDIQFLGLAENNLEVLNRQVQAARDRFEVGEVRRTDVNLAEAAAAGAQAAVARAQGGLEITRESFHITVGKFPGQLKNAPPLPQIPSSLAAAQGIAARTHPAILRAQLVAKAGELNVLRAETAMKPKLMLSGSYNASSATTPSDSAAISLGATIPLYSGGALVSARRQAMALREQAQATLHLTARSVAQGVAIAWATIGISKASIIARHKEVRASRVALQGIREEASLGALTTLDILNAERDLSQAESNLVAAQHDQYVAVYSLLSSMGLLTVKHLGLGIKTYDPNVNYKKVSTAPQATDRGKLLSRILKRAGKK